MVPLERKGSGRGYLQMKIFYILLTKNTGKVGRARGNTGNLVLIGAWQPCMSMYGMELGLLQQRSEQCSFPIHGQILIFMRWRTCWTFIGKGSDCSVVLSKYL